MIDIPQNEKARDFEGEVEQAIGWILNDSRWEKCGWGSVGMNHSKDKEWVMNDVAAEVARRFKEKGYFARYSYSVRGIAYELVISKTPSNRDI